MQFCYNSIAIYTVLSRRHDFCKIRAFAGTLGVVPRHFQLLLMSGGGIGSVPVSWGKVDVPRFLGGAKKAGLIGGGILSLGEGSSKVRRSSAHPLGMALRWNSAVLPCLQKFVTWDNWCLVKSSAVGLQPKWGADTLVLVVAAPAAIAQLGRWPSKGFSTHSGSQLSQVVSPHWPFS